MDKLYTLMTDLNQQGSFITICGPISFDLIIGISSTIKQKMKLEMARSSTVLKVFSVFVENAENIIRYSAHRFSDDDGGEMGQGIIMIGFNDGNYFISSGNLIDSSKVEKLSKKLSNIQNLSKPELKEYYRKKRKQAPDEGSKGASLGFLEIAKKACKPIDFSFKKVDDKYSFFFLRTAI